jgi:hypothetical protein
LSKFLHMHEVFGQYEDRFFALVQLQSGGVAGA